MGHQHLLQQSEAKFGRWTLAAGDMSFLTYQGMNVGVIDLHDNLEIIEYGSLLADLHVLPVHEGKQIEFLLANLWVLVAIWEAVHIFVHGT